MRKHLKSLLCIAALTTAGAASAQKAGDDIVSIGLASINPDANVGTLSNVGGPSYIAPALAGTSAHVGSKMTTSFGWLHMFTDNIGAEFTIGLPPTVTQDLTTPGAVSLGAPVNHPGAANIDIWTPTAIGKYFFGTAQDTWRPYVGFGVSRVSFHNVTTLNDGGLITGLAGNSASLSSAWSPVYNAGMIYNINDKWSINGSISYLPIKTDATFVGADGTTTGSIKLNTTDYVIRLGYRF